MYRQVEFGHGAAVVVDDVVGVHVVVPEQRVITTVSGHGCTVVVVVVVVVDVVPHGVVVVVSPGFKQPQPSVQPSVQFGKQSG